MSVAWILVAAYIGGSGAAVVEPQAYGYGAFARPLSYPTEAACERALVWPRSTDVSITFPADPHLVSRPSYYCVPDDGLHLVSVPPGILLRSERR